MISSTDNDRNGRKVFHGHESLKMKSGTAHAAAPSSAQPAIPLDWKNCEGNYGFIYKKLPEVSARCFFGSGFPRSRK